MTQIAETIKELAAEKRDTLLGRKVIAVIGEKAAATLSPSDWDVLSDLLGWVPNMDGTLHHDNSYPDASDPRRVMVAVRAMENRRGTSSPL